jgi:hypothetical protein
MRNKFFLSLAVLAIGAVTQADVVLDQMPVNMADMDAINASQDFEATFDTFDVGVIDDFTVNANQTLVTSVQAMMGGFSGFTSGAQWANVTGFRVEFYTSIASGAANLTGNAGSQLVSAGSATIFDPAWSSFSGTVRRVTLPVNVVLPGAGTYWVAVIGVMPATSNINQIGVGNNLAILGGSNAHLINPAGGFGMPGNNQNTNMSAAYRVEATAVPEPGSMIALGLGAAALAARRRRKAA